MKILKYWVGSMLVSGASIAIVVFLLWQFKILTIPFEFIFYYAVIDGTVTTLMKGVNTWSDSVLNKKGD